MKRRVLSAQVFEGNTVCLEKPKHRVLETAGMIESHDYEPALFAEAETSVEHIAAINGGLRMLAGYIVGGNQGGNKIAVAARVMQAPEPVQKQGEKIAMTAPLTQEPVGAANEARWRVHGSAGSPRAGRGPPMVRQGDRGL